MAEQQSFLLDDEGPRAAPAYRLSRERAIKLCKSSRSQIVAKSTREGWAIHLLDFVELNHRLPFGSEIQTLIDEFNGINQSLNSVACYNSLLKKAVAKIHARRLMIAKLLDE